MTLPKEPSPNDSPRPSERFKGSLTSTCSIVMQGSLEGDVEVSAAP